MDGLDTTGLGAEPFKEKTPFEKKRAAATTFDELVELGREHEMNNPEAWADFVIEARNNS